MSSLVGFSIFHGLSGLNERWAQDAQLRALGYYKHLICQTIEIGQTKLAVWGHPELSECLHWLPDGDLLVLIGSPHNKVPWSTIEEGLLKATHLEEYDLPWDGRVILLRVSADGMRWRMWNDWIGSIPVYHAQIGGGRIASTLEPVVVAGGGYTPDDFFLPGLVSLLINGHFLSDWTLYRDMKVVPPDSVAEWDGDGFCAKRLWTVKPSQERWESSWDDLVDEMYALSYKAIADVLKTQPRWILPLSSGLDSRLIAAVGADIGANMYAYTWGGKDSTDVVYSRQIAKVLGIPWKHIELPSDFLVKYTRQWVDLFGSAMHFHGMYQMSFLDILRQDLSTPILSGYLDDILSGNNLIKSIPTSIKLYNEWYTLWSVDELKKLLRISLDSILPELAESVISGYGSLYGSHFQRLLMFELWSRQRYFTNFQAEISNYWQGIAVPFLNRSYARFCFSLPRVALDGRRLLGDVYRRYYGKLAVIPGTYGNEPFIRTGRYLMKRHIANLLPIYLQVGPFRGFRDVQLRMDVDSLHANGFKALWPIREAWDRLSEWVDVSQIESTFQAAMSQREDIRPLRKLQSVQTLAYRLLDHP